MPRPLHPYVSLAILGIASATACAQFQPEDARLALFGGPALHTGASSQPMQLGMGAEANLFHPAANGLSLSPAVEGGFFHPAISGKGNYYVSLDAMLGFAYPYRAITDTGTHAFFVAGYSRIFNATDTALTPANAVNVGVGLDRRLNSDFWLRLEVREHYTPASDSHALVVRVGVITGWSLQ